MLLTYNLKHGLDLSNELEKGRKIAEIAIKAPRLLSSKEVSFIGLKSIIANQILRKYGNKKTIKKAHKIILPVPGQGIMRENDMIRISCLKCMLPFNLNVEKINYIEFDKEYAHIIYTVAEPPQYVPECTFGVDRNTTGHVAVVACPETGKVEKYGKQCNHIRKTYSSMRRTAQKEGVKKKRHKHRKTKIYKHKEKNKVKNINHHISKVIVTSAKEQKAAIVLEDLKSIRRTAKAYGRSRKYSLNSWSFYDLQTKIEYKARMHGVPVVYVSPEYTSQMCSKCGEIGERDGKLFKCPHCGHADHADVNAGFNIALRGRLNADRDAFKGCTDAPKGATLYIEELLFGYVR